MRLYLIVLGLLLPVALAAQAVPPIAPPLTPPAATTAAPAQTAPALSAWEILRRAIPVQEANDRALENYAWHERDIERSLNKKGEIQKIADDETFDVSQVGGVQYRRLIARHGQPLSPAEQAKQDRKLANFIAKQDRQTPEQVAAREQRRAKERRDRKELVAQVQQAFRFTLLGRRQTPLCDCYIVAGTPLASFHPHDDNLKLLQHFAGQAWIDAHSFAPVRLELNVVKPVSFGWFLVRLGKGGEIDLQGSPVAGHWFPSELTGTLSARVALVKALHVGLEQQYTDYRKFQVSTRLLVAKPAAPQP